MLGTLLRRFSILTIWAGALWFCVDTPERWLIPGSRVELDYFQWVAGFADLPIALTIVVLAPLPFFVYYVILQLLRLSSPRLIFESPDSNHNIPFFDHAGENRKRVSTIDILYTSVRNCPVNRIDGKTAKQAHGKVTVYKAGTRDQVNSFRYPRWEAKLKPREDEKEFPKFLEIDNIMDIEANNAPYRIDFAIKHQSDEDFYGFPGASQNIRGSWRNDKRRIAPGEYDVEVLIEASNLRAPASQWLRVTLADNVLNVSELKVSGGLVRFIPEWLKGSISISKKAESSAN